jgi:hypothetical protein
MRRIIEAISSQLSAFSFLRDLGAVFVNFAVGRLCTARQQNTKGFLGSDHFPYPSFDRLTQFPQPALKEMICAFDQDQLLWFGKGGHNSFKLHAWCELVAGTAYEQLRFRAALKKIQIVTASLRGKHRQAQANHGPNSLVRTSHPQTYSRSEGESREDEGQMELAIKPVESSANVIDFADAVIVLALAQPRPTKVEAQDRPAKAVQGLHGVKYDFVVKSSTIERMWMTHQSGVSGVFCPHVEQGFKTAGWAIKE